MMDLDRWDVKQTTESGWKAFQTTVEDVFRTVLRPPERKPLAEWSNENIIIPSQPEPGPFRWQRAPYQKEMLDVAGDPSVSKVVLVMAVQSGKTVTLMNTAAYYMAADPSNIMIVQTTNGEAKKFSQSKLQPLLNASPRMSDTLRFQGSAENTMLRKVYPGGYLVIVGAAAETAFRMLTIRILLLDEVDSYTENVEGAGDVLSLARGRTTAIPDSKEIIASTPLHEETSIVWKEFSDSDQRHFYVPCPHCGQYQIIRWRNIKYDNDDPRTARWICDFTEDRIKDDYWLLENRYYVSSGVDLEVVRSSMKVCGKDADESYKHRMLEKGIWVQHQPTSLTPGFHLPAMYSPWYGWDKLVEEWLKAKKLPDRLQAFTNQRLAEPWSEAYERIEAPALLGRLEKYDADRYDPRTGNLVERGCPTGVGIITAAVDVQSNRLICTTYGWGATEECWLLDTVTFPGFPDRDEGWSECASYLLDKRFKTKRGAEVRIATVAVDTGDITDKAYQFVATLRALGVNAHAVKGGRFKNPALPNTPTKIKQFGINLYVLGVHSIKDRLFERLALDPPGPGTMHFGWGTELNYFEELTAERKTRKINRRTGRPEYEYKVIRRDNHQLDLWVYNYAALQLLSPTISSDLAGYAEEVANAEAIGGTEPEDEPQEKAPPEPTIQHFESGLIGNFLEGNWLDGFGRL